MSTDPKRDPGLERSLATMLHLGTWVGSCIVAVGWAAAAIAEPPWLRTVAVAIELAGIGLFVLLPVLRVLLMVVVFIREHDYRFGAIAALVLTIIVIGAAWGVYMADAVPG